MFRTWRTISKKEMTNQVFRKEVGILSTHELSSASSLSLSSSPASHPSRSSFFGSRMTFKRLSQTPRSVSPSLFSPFKEGSLLSITSSASTSASSFLTTLSSSHSVLWNPTDRKLFSRTIYHRKEGIELLELDYTPIKINNEEEEGYLFGLEFFGTQGDSREIYGEQPSILLLHENWGLNAYVRHFAQDLANKGFKVITPDLFGGKRTTEPSEALKLEKEFDWEKGLRHVQLWIKHLRTPGYGEQKSRVGIVGVGLGGGLAIAASIRLQKVFCAASLYGLPPFSAIPLPPHLTSSTATASTSTSTSTSPSSSTPTSPTSLSLPPVEQVKEGYLPIPLVVVLGEKDEVTGTLHDNGRFKSYQEYFDAASNETPLTATLTTTPAQSHGFMNFTIPNKKRKALGMTPYEHEIACTTFDLIAEYCRDILVRDPNPEF